MFNTPYLRPNSAVFKIFLSILPILLAAVCIAGVILVGGLLEGFCTPGPDDTFVPVVGEGAVDIGAPV